MSWVEKELKRRVAAMGHEPTKSLVEREDLGAQEAPAHIRLLWRRVEEANEELPAELRLQREEHQPDRFPSELPPFPVALVADNRACLGFTEDGIRYLWPKRTAGKSNNFWIRWKADQGYVVSRRVGGSMGSPVTAEHAFDATSVDHMIKCLVMGRRIRTGTLRPGRFLFIWPRR